AEEILTKTVSTKVKEKFKVINKKIKERIKYELGIIVKKGYAPYFLIVSDMVNWANSEGIVTNTRGSAAGSLVSYVLGITTVGPLKYNLPFERFLNPYRPSPPDIDFDIADNKRDDVIKYMSEKYGKEKVAQICTFGRMKARASVRDISRVLGHPYSFGDKISKLIPLGSQGFPMTIEKAMTVSSDFRSLYDEDKDAKKVIDLAKSVEGNARHLSVHAAGLVISPKELTEFTPVQLEPSGDKIITQYEMHACEDVGLIKFDILGIRNLSILSSAIKNVKEERNIVVDLGRIPIDDKKTYEMLARGETMGTFQLSSAGMTRFLKELKPTRIEDLMAMVALYRPGPMKVIPEYIERKKNPALIKYLDPRMKKFLDMSYGLIVYQDDLLFCALELAGYSWKEADKFRKAVGKKIPEEMAAQKKKFIDGIVKNGQTQEFAENLWKLFEPFQSYGFNKAHAASYGMVAYQTAYMKANYPVEFMNALLTAESGDSEKISLAVNECRRMKIKVLPPDINDSNIGFKIIKDKDSLEGKAILFGLSAIKNVGNAAIEAILLAREEGSFMSLFDFLARVDARKVNKKSCRKPYQSWCFIDVWSTRKAFILFRRNKRKSFKNSSFKRTTRFI
ncbi:DNA polymerase III subunit alpha, partial [Patescibacteria group bacterium]|nr:DNA polymerase III subunit alpha [Patescibacteria group bacterium]